MRETGSRRWLAQAIEAAIASRLGFETCATAIRHAQMRELLQQLLTAPTRGRSKCGSVHMRCPRSQQLCPLYVLVTRRGIMLLPTRVLLALYVASGLVFPVMA